MSDLLSALNDDQAMARGISGEPNPRLRDLLDGLQPDDPVRLTRLRESGLLDVEAEIVVAHLIETWPLYTHHRLRVLDVQTSTHPCARLPGGPGDQPWAKTGNLYSYICPVDGGGHGKALYVWLCLAAPGTSEG